MPVRASAVAALLLVARVTGGDEAGPAPAGAHVIAAGLEALFLEMARPPASSPWTLVRVAIEQGVAALVYRDTKGLGVTIRLVHPSVSGPVLARTAKFALVADGTAPSRALVDELVGRVRACEPRFSWTTVSGPAPPSPASPSSPASPAKGQNATLPEDARPPDWLAAPDLALTDDTRPLHGQALELVRSGRLDPARRIAAQLKPAAPAAAASLLRRIGDGAAAAELLSAAVERAGPTMRDALPLQLAASLELAGRRPEAQRALALLRQPPVPAPACARAQALTLLIVEGRGADVMRITEADWARGPRCVLQLRLRAAMSVADDRAVDAAGRAAAAADPRDTNLFYMWGSYYYNRRRFKEAQQGWDRVAVLDPAFPGFLGLYGTAIHIQDVLKGPLLERQLARARANQDDVVANHLAGLGLYYLRKYDQSLPLFANVRRLNDEPRAGMYLAMSRFFTGDVEGAMHLLEELEPMAFREPDIYYCRSLVWRFYDLPRAVKEMQSFLDVSSLPDRSSFGPQKVDKAKDDLLRMKRGEVPSVYLAGQGSYTPPPRKQR